MVLDHGVRRRLMAHALLHPFSNLSRFLDVAAAATSLDELAEAFWPG